MKYIIFDEIYPVLFLDALYHGEITCSRKPTSAGNFSIAKDGKVNVWGESSGLSLRSGPEDAVLIDKFLKN